MNLSPIIWFYLNQDDGITPVPPGEKYRITETLANRITENGDLRVTEPQ